MKRWKAIKMKTRRGDKEMENRGRRSDTWSREFPE
jgi:hypothetical protein